MLRTGVAAVDNGESEVLARIPREGFPRISDVNGGYSRPVLSWHLAQVSLPRCAVVAPLGTNSHPFSPDVVAGTETIT